MSLTDKFKSINKTVTNLINHLLALIIFLLGLGIAAILNKIFSSNFPAKKSNWVKIPPNSDIKKMY